MNDKYNFTPSAPRDKIWLFNSAGSFSGNVKYLFLYITNYRPDIFACYITGDKKNASYIESLGYRVCQFSSQEGKELMKQAGVYVNEQLKEHYPIELLNAKLLNLYHGVGLKVIERKWDRDSLNSRIAKKYIKYNEHYIKNMCFLATSPFMEAHFTEQIYLSPEQIIRAGYPRTIYQSQHGPVTTFEHDLFSGRELSEETQMVLYAPTYREEEQDNFLSKAIKDIHALSKILKKNNFLMIIKLHPRISNDIYFKQLQRTCNHGKNILLWDNKYDIYEILERIDIAIIDYSSIYYDLVAAGVKKFIRYIFDYDRECQFLIYNYFDYTSGAICRSFAELLAALDSPIEEDAPEKTAFINNTFWSYSDARTCERIIEQTLAFTPDSGRQLPTLYSFDVFDTLIYRKVLQPRGIFYYVQDKVRDSLNLFPEIFKNEYVAIRMQAESNVREFITKNIGHFEITFDAIFHRMSDILTGA